MVSLRTDRVGEKLTIDSPVLTAVGFTFSPPPSRQKTARARVITLCDPRRAPRTTNVEMSAFYEPLRNYMIHVYSKFGFMQQPSRPCATNMRFGFEPQFSIK